MPCGFSGLPEGQAGAAHSQRYHLVFKGGTSLSKCYDLILDWRLLDIAEKDPWADRSKNQQDKFNKALNAETEVFLTVMPERTFWEKVTILHKEAFRTNGNFPVLLPLL